MNASPSPRYTAGQVMLETADRLVVQENDPAVQRYLLLVGALRVLDRTVRSLVDVER